MLKELFIDEKKDMLKQSLDKVICKYRVVDDTNNKAEGELYFMGEIYNFVSGGAGKGYAPKGNYKAYGLLQENREAFKQFNFGWQVPLDAQFMTERWGLAIHPDGGVPNTTLGCIGLNFGSLDENVKCHNLFRDYFEKSNVLNVEIV